MDNLNHIFFEEYKHLDKLCGEIYGEQHGITHYIDDMRGISEWDSRNIPNWKDDLEQLRHLRHIRNNLAHAENAFNEEHCTQKEIEWCQNFHRRILNQSDPLAILHQYSKAKQQAAKPRASAPRLQPPQSSAQYNMTIEETRKLDSQKISAPKSSYRTVLFFIIVGLLLLIMFGTAVFLGMWLYIES